MLARWKMGLRGMSCSPVSLSSLLFQWHVWGFSSPLSLWYHTYAAGDLKSSERKDQRLKYLWKWRMTQNKLWTRGSGRSQISDFQLIINPKPSLFTRMFTKPEVRSVFLKLSCFSAVVVKIVTCDRMWKKGIWYSFIFLIHVARSYCEEFLRSSDGLKKNMNIQMNIDAILWHIKTNKKYHQQDNVYLLIHFTFSRQS